MSEYNFDPMTGEPIPKQTEAAEGAPTAEQPVYHYVRPEQDVTPEPPIYRPQEPQYTPSYTEQTAAPHYEPNYEQPPIPPQKKKRPAKPLTLKGILPVIAVTAVLSLVLGLVGGVLGAKYFGEEVTIAEGAAVIYKTTKLKDADGKEVKEALTIPEVAELVKSSVVEITTEQIVTGSFMHQYVAEGAGSGVIITADGYIVTNHHVIDGATNIKVRLADGTEYSAKLIGSDAKSDLAVIKVEAKELTPAAYGSSAELMVGEEVVAVGNPLGKLGGTVTKGIISALDREITLDNTTMRLLQTDTAINPGNSGGGMFNTSGQLVGVINAKSAGEEIEGLGFAIPIDTAKTVIEDLIGHGYVTGRVDPGFTFVEVNDTMSAMMYRVSELGLYISAVDAGSDAEKAGFQSGDYVVKVEGKEVTTEAEANAIIDGKKAGDTITIVVKRNGKEKSIALTLSEYVPTVSNPQETPNFGNPFFN